MNWKKIISDALKYIESNITKELTPEKIAKHLNVASSSFQQIFKAFCKLSLGEYIRNRRLSLAGEEILAGNDKIIDIAMRYNYDSQDGFDKAFKRFHGLTPTQARKKGAKLKSFAPLKIEISLYGGFEEEAFTAFVNADANTSDNSKFKNKMEIQEELKMIKDETMKYKAKATLFEISNETPITGERHGKTINAVITQIVDKVGNTNSPCQENLFATLSHKGFATHLVSRCLMSVDSPHTSEDKIKNIVMANLCNHKCLYTFENEGYNSFDKSFRNAINDISSKNKGSITTADFLLIAENIKNYCEEYYKKCPNEVSKVFFETEFYKNTASYVEDIINEIFPFLDYCFGSPYVEYYSKIFDDYKNEPTFIYDKEFDSLCSKLYHSDMTQHERNIIEAIRDVYIYELKILSAMDFCEKLRYSKNLEYISTEEAAFDWLEQVINSGRRLAKIDEIEKAVNRPNPCEECIKMMEDDLENDTDDHYDEVCTYLSDNDQWDHWYSEAIGKAIDVYCNDLNIVSGDDFAKALDITDEWGDGDFKKLERILEAKKHCYSIDW